MLRGLKASEQKRLLGRIVLLLTASSHYALHGVRPGVSLASARRHVKLGRPFTVGRNDWYLVANGASRGILKVQHNRVDEIGIVDKLPTRDRRQAMRLLETLH